MNVTVEALPPTDLKSAPGGTATLRLSEGRTFGLVPSVDASGEVSITLHDMSTTPHTLLGTRNLLPSATVRFEETSPAVSVRLAGQ